MVFVHWLIYQSVFVIGALCPYCMVVWAVTIPTFFYVTVHNLARQPGSRVMAGQWSGSCCGSTAPCWRSGCSL